MKENKFLFIDGKDGVSLWLGSVNLVCVIYLLEFCSFSRQKKVEPV